MRPIAVLTGAALVALGATSAQAEVRITGDPGGLMAHYASRFMSVRDTGDNVVIDGPCFSACTMVLGFVPRERVCVTRNAVLGFHAAWRYDGAGRRVTSAAATQALAGLYPQRIRSWIAQRGGLSPKMKFLSGRELASMYPVCGATATAELRNPQRAVPVTVTPADRATIVRPRKPSARRRLP